MSFASNVAPKRKIRDAYPGRWRCPNCKQLNPSFVRVCLSSGCREVRPNESGQSGL